MSDLALVPEVVPSLAECEEVIEQGLHSFVEVGLALKTINEQGYYSRYGTFEDYCRERWNFTFGRGYQLVRANELCTNVQSRGLPAPATEAVARELIRIKDDPDRQAEAWSEVIEASGGKPTAKLVKEVVAKYVKTKKKKNKGKASRPDEDDQAEAEQTALLSFLYNTADRLSKLAVSFDDAAALIPTEQLFRFDKIEVSIDWLIDFSTAIRQRRALPSDEEQQEHAAEIGESIHG